MWTKTYLRFLLLLFPYFHVWFVTYMSEKYVMNKFNQQPHLLNSDADAQRRQKRIRDYRCVFRLIMLWFLLACITQSKVEHWSPALALRLINQLLIFSGNRFAAGCWGHSNSGALWFQNTHRNCLPQKKVDTPDSGGSQFNTLQS